MGMGVHTFGTDVASRDRDRGETARDSSHRDARARGEIACTSRVGARARAGGTL